MGGRKNKNGIWHHRVPDFKLVYCGREDDCPETEIKISPVKKKKLQFDEHNLTKVDFKNKKNLIKSKE